MGDTMERITILMKDKGLKDKDVCEYANIKQSTFATWKQKGRDPKIEYLPDIAEFLGVSTDYLTTGKETDWEPTITEKDERDIKKVIEGLKNQLAGDAGLMYDGEPMDEESKEAVLAAIEVAERTARLSAREKYTPKKYRK